MSELKPCPFCGGEAQLMHMDLDTIDEGWKVWGVWCVNDLHAEEHGGYQHGHFIDNYGTEAEAIEAWNTRAEQVIAATLGGGKLTAEQVRQAVNGHGNIMDNRFYCDWQAVADELDATLGGGECEVVKSYGRHPITNNEVVLYNCSKCGKWIGLTANYCPHCGAKVRKVVKR